MARADRTLPMPIRDRTPLATDPPEICIKGVHRLLRHDTQHCHLLCTKRPSTEVERALLCPWLLP